MKKNIIERIDDLEKRIAALELQLKDGKRVASEIVSSWESILLEFSDAFNLEAKAFRKKHGTSSKREERL